MGYIVIFNHLVAIFTVPLLVWRIVQRILRGQLIEVFKYLNGLITATARTLFDYNRNDRTRNNRFPEQLLKDLVS